MDIACTEVELPNLRLLSSLLELSAQYTEAITHPVTHPRSIDDTTKAQEVPETASFSRRHRVASHAAPLVAGPNSEGRLDHLIKFKREGERGGK